MAYIDSSALTPENLRVNTAILFFSAVLDLFLSVILWFVLDDEKSPAVFVDENKVYAVIDVI